MTQSSSTNLNETPAHRDAGAGCSWILSPPVLQQPTATGMSIVWAVRGLAMGWVEYGPSPDSLIHRAEACEHGQVKISDRFLAVRIEGLSPGQRVHYRIGVIPLDFPSAYNIRPGQTEYSQTDEFSTLNPDAATMSFAVISDTHEQQPVIDSIFEQLSIAQPEVLIWNGDMFNSVSQPDQIVSQILNPSRYAYASHRPVVFGSGNHDVRGSYAGQLTQAILPGSSSFGRCFALRHGPVALIGLDTGEDKPDHHPAFAGLARFEPYREAQAQWLKETLERPDIASAAWVVVFTHIPLWGRPGDNPGNTLTGYAFYSLHAQQCWHPLLEQHRIQLLISGHLHEHRYDAPDDQHSYPQIAVGAPQLSKATYLLAHIHEGLLEVTLIGVENQQVLGQWKLPPRARQA